MSARSSPYIRSVVHDHACGFPVESRWPGRRRVHSCSLQADTREINKVKFVPSKIAAFKADRPHPSGFWVKPLRPPRRVSALRVIDPLKNGRSRARIDSASYFNLGADLLFTGEPGYWPFCASCGRAWCTFGSHAMPVTTQFRQTMFPGPAGRRLQARRTRQELWRVRYDGAAAEGSEAAGMPLQCRDARYQPSAPGGQ